MLDETAKTCEQSPHTTLKDIRFFIYQIHFEITGDPCHLIGSQLCDLFTIRNIFLLEMTFVLNRTIFPLYCIISVLNTKLDVKVFLFLLLLDPYNFGTDRIRRFQNGSN